jgi:hypothetical protein
MGIIITGLAVVVALMEMPQAAAQVMAIKRLAQTTQAMVLIRQLWVVGQTLEHLLTQAQTLAQVAVELVLVDIVVAQAVLV